MLAHHATRAGSSRASFVGGVSPPSAKVVKTTNESGSSEKSVVLNEGATPPGRPAWKYAYEDLLWSRQKLPLKLRAILQVFLRLSDHLGRVWWSQAAIAEQAGCTVRTLRRLLPALEASGYARIEAMTFRQLAVAQAELGLPLPGRNDDGQAPDLITLLVAGKPATDLRPALRRRSSHPAPVRTFGAADCLRRPSPQTPGQPVQGPPRTSLSFEPPDNPPDPADSSSADPRDLSADLYKHGGDPVEHAHPFQNSSKEGPEDPAVHNDEPKLETNSAPDERQTDEQAWLVLQAAYDRHYRRVYHARPTNKPLTVESRLLLAGHLADMATVLRARFVERNIDLTTLEKSPLELLADEALRVWFDSSGTNDYLRRVSHRISALPADLPYRVRKAIETLLERLAPRPEPRRAVNPVLPLVHTVGRPLPTDTQVVAPQPQFTANVHAPSRPTVAKTNLTPDVLQVLEGLSQHAALHDLAQTPTLATELATIAKDRGASMPQLLEALDAAAKVCQRQRTASNAARSGIVYKLVLERFHDPPPRISTA